MLPHDEELRQEALRIVSRSFQRHSYLPIDTPILEYAETLLGKSGGETEKQVYRFKDAGARDLAMRFDLTVPFARFIAMHIGELYTPFRRYHIGKVFRGENTQKGRYREFVQCDFDLVGSSSIAADFEILSLVAATMEALQAGAITIHLSHRGLLDEFLGQYAPDAESHEVLKAVDKVRKTGIDTLFETLRTMLDDRALRSLRTLMESKGETLIQYTEELGFDDIAAYFRSVQELAASQGLTDILLLDATIARGLDYYTGMVFECFLDEDPHLGSICSGGRYDSLTSMYTTQELPCVGGSIGLDRLLSSGRIAPRKSGKKILVLNLDEAFLPQYHRIARDLRKRGHVVEIFPDVLKFSKQFQYAEKKGIDFGIVCGKKEIENDFVMLRNMQLKSNTGPHRLEVLSELIK